jgi:hypothetical protein
MSAPPRKPFRRQTFVLEIDLDQILLGLPHEMDDSVGDCENNSEDRDSNEDRQYRDNEYGDTASADAPTAGDRQSRPPRQPSRRSTVRVALDLEQLQAFEEWRKQYAASDENDEMSSSIMDSTIDTTALSGADKAATESTPSLHILEARQGISSDADAAEGSTGNSPPKQPRRRSTLIVTLGQPQGLHNYDDDIEYDDVSCLDGLHDSASGEAHHRSFNLGSATGQDGSAYGGSFSEDSVDTSVFVELFCKQVLEAQEQKEQVSHPHRRGRRRLGFPSPRASLRLRGPVHHLRHLMPELERIDSVGTVVDDDDDNNNASTPRNPEQLSLQPRPSTKVTAREYSTPENSTRRKAGGSGSLLDDDPDCDVASSEHGRAIACARKMGHDTHPVAPVRALSNQSAATSHISDRSGPTRPGRRRSSGTGSHRSGAAPASPPSSSPTADHNPVQPARRATLILPPSNQAPENGADDEANEVRALAVENAPDGSACGGNQDPTEVKGAPTGLCPGGYVLDGPFAKGGSAEKERALRESVLTVATEVSWESQDDDYDDDDDDDDDDDEEEEDEERGDGSDDPVDSDANNQAEKFPTRSARGNARATSSPCHPRRTGSTTTRPVNAGC